MTCSKLFSGDLPEMTIHIIKYLGNDRQSLHSCILVNRFWCCAAIPLLWKNPFSTVPREEIHHFLDIYFLFLNDDDKKKFRMYKVGHRMNSFSFKPSFDYPSFIKTLNTFQLEFHVVNWLNFIQQGPSNVQPYTLFTKYNDFYNESLKVLENKKCSLGARYNKMAKDFCILLFKLFMNKNASLNNLSINIPSDSIDHFFVEIYDSILRKPEFISNIENFASKSISPNIQPFLTSLPSILSSIKNLNYYLSADTLLTKDLENIIQSQAKLSSLTLSFNTASDIANINSLFKYCSRTLTTLRFSDCNFGNNFIRFKPLQHLTQLKSLHFIRCAELKLDLIQPLLDIPIPLRIHSLTLDCCTKITVIQSLFQKIGAYLQNLFINLSLSPTEALDCVIDNCEKIKFLYLSTVNGNIPKVFQLIKHFKDDIEYLTIEYHHYNHDNIRSSPILKELGQNFPVNLKYLNLCLPIFTNDLKFFLKNCKKIELKKLLITNERFSSRNNLQLLNAFVKEKNLEYLAFAGSVNDVSENFMEKIQSFVNIRRYEDLVLDITDLDENNENRGDIF